MDATLTTLLTIYCTGCLVRLGMLLWEDTWASVRRRRLKLPPPPEAYTREDLLLIPFEWPLAVGAWIARRWGRR